MKDFTKPMQKKQSSSKKRQCVRNIAFYKFVSYTYKLYDYQVCKQRVKELIFYMSE